MRRFWIWGVTIIAVSAAIMAASPRPVRPSGSLLGKAQSEFAEKARYALMQRQIARAPATSASTEAIPLPVSLETAATARAIARDTSRQGSRLLTAEDLESLRTRSPELAAAMARYM